MKIALLLYVPMFIYIVYKGEVVYTQDNLIWCNIKRIFLTVNYMLMSIAVEYGEGSPLQAIENQKSVLTAILLMPFYGIYPNNSGTITMTISF